MFDEESLHSFEQEEYKKPRKKVQKHISSPEGNESKSRALLNSKQYQGTDSSDMQESETKIRNQKRKSLV